jgi:hypothetical protein
MSERKRPKSRPKNKLSDGTQVSNRDERFEIDWVIGTGWIHTHGLAERGYPEIEVREVPDFLAEFAAGLIRHVCDYMLDAGVRINPGETMATSDRTRFRFIKAEPEGGDENHYTVERLRIVDVEHMCDCCGLKSSELN